MMTSDDSLLDVLTGAKRCLNEAHEKIAAQDAKIAALSDAIAAWPVVPHWYDCQMFAKHGSFYLETNCTCGVGDSNAARARGRKAAGLED